MRFDQRRFLVHVPEESRVLKPRSQHARIPVPYDRRAFFVRLRIQHRQKMRRQLALCIFHREILLVIAHHRHQNLFRQSQILALKVAQNHARPLGQVRHRLNQRFVLAPSRTLRLFASPRPMLSV